jgi:hypothetical protein
MISFLSLAILVFVAIEVWLFHRKLLQFAVVLTTILENLADERYRDPPRENRFRFDMDTVRWTKH